MVLDEVVPHPQYRMCHSRIVSAPPPEVRDELYRVTWRHFPWGMPLRRSASCLPGLPAGGITP